MLAEWYPTQLSDRIPWHKNFVLQANSTGVPLGLTSAQVTQIGIDASELERVVHFFESVQAFGRAVTEHKDLVLEGDTTVALPPTPIPPMASEATPGSLPGIMARTQQFVGILKSSARYSPEFGMHYGILGSDSIQPESLSLEVEVLWQSEIRLVINRCGYSVVAIDSKNEAGDWVQIGISQTIDYIDDRRPLVIGQPELREFRAQGITNNERVGALSAVVSAMTMP